jgi:hypothetical protein
MRFHVEPVTDQAAENEIDRLLRTEGELRAEVERLTAALECWKGRAMNYVAEVERLTALAQNNWDAIVRERDEELRTEVARMTVEVATWRSRYEAERKDHEATMKAWDEERSGL